MVYIPLIHGGGSSKPVGAKVKKLQFERKKFALKIAIFKCQNCNLRWQFEMPVIAIRSYEKKRTKRGKKSKKKVKKSRKLIGQKNIYPIGLKFQ